MGINYIVLVHKFPLHLRRLVTRLNNDNVSFYVHVDKKCEITTFKDSLMEFENVFFEEENRINVIWGDFSQIEATILMLNRVVKDKRKGYCVLLSGQDYPIKSNKEIVSYFKENYGINFISILHVNELWNDLKAETYNRLSRYNYHVYSNKRQVVPLYSIYETAFYSLRNLKNILRLLYHGKLFSVLKNIFLRREHPKNVKPYGGSQWWALPMDTVNNLLRYLDKNKLFIKYHYFTHVPDEIFFHSVIAYLVDFNKIKESVTYVNWSRKNTQLPVTFTDDHDFEELENSSCLFARKFNEDTEILDRIDAELL